LAVVESWGRNPELRAIDGRKLTMKIVTSITPKAIGHSNNAERLKYHGM
jgi:hypothetical protein